MNGKKMNSESKEDLLKRIAFLEGELEKQRQAHLPKEKSEEVDQGEACKHVLVPGDLQPVFKSAQRYVEQYFKERSENPEKGTIEIQGERYIMIRAASMSLELFKTVRTLYEDRGKEEAHNIASGMLFDLAHSLGKADAKSFHTKMNVTDPLEKLSAGPVHFAFTGWAFVKILPGGLLTPDDRFNLMYEHPFSFESDVWLLDDEKPDFPVCIMNAGYSSGWCEESFGLPLVSVEVECRARGDKECRFIIGTPGRIEGLLENYKSHNYKGDFDIKKYGVPEFFQRKKLEDKVRSSEETARALMNATDESALLVDISGIILALNQNAANRFGGNSEKFVGSNCFDLFSPQLAESRRFHHKKVIETKKPVHYQDVRDQQWLDNYLYPVLDSLGNVAGLAIYSKDVTDLKQKEVELKKYRLHLEELVAERTQELEKANQNLLKEIRERKNAEKALRDQKERLAVTLKSIGEGVIVTDIDGRVTLSNHVAGQLSQFSIEDMEGLPIDRVLPLGREEKSRKKKISLVDSMKENRVLDLGGDIFLYREKGEEILLGCSLAPIMDKNEVVGYIFVFRDITEARRIEEELQRQRRIESIGVLAGGIAHDFNNLLMAIMGNISIIKTGTSQESRDYSRLTSCENAIQRAKNLTHQLLTFSKGGAPVKKVMSLDVFLKDTIEFTLSGSSIMGFFDLPGDLWAVEIDEGQFSQVINNLVINSMQAMKDGGDLRVKVENFELKERKFSLKMGKYLRITLSDGGEGIAPEHINKVFDPYFTTKETGSGLGLAMVYSIIKKHNGHIEVESTPGRGTSFYIYIPVSKKSPASPAKKKEELQSNISGRVLFMDDEEMIREVGQEMFESFGYGVDLVSEGEEAVELYTKRIEEGNPYDLVVLDLTIPGGLGGKETMKLLKNIDPQVKAIVSSGYSNDTIMANYMRYGFKAVLEKPFKIEELQEVLEKLKK